ncbi:hypothetical protein [Pontibacter pamirensis]|uniref:hypothetical protein n=1 Tax=Pontibacter pamirensis TaxID=2562824 RepID=UPI0013897023|nr:hypothetical protein [Pontibacter pamirensis]
MPALLFCGVVALSSCDKNEQESVNPEFTQGMLSQILADSSKVTSFSFAGKQLSQVNHYHKESGEAETFEKYEYDGTGKLTKASMHATSDNALLTEQKYTYNSKGLLAKIDMAYHKEGKIEYTAYATFDYDEKNNLQKKSLFEVSNDDKGEKDETEAIQKSYTTYEVLPNGNYAEEKQYVIDGKGKASLFSTTTYSYDTNQNPLHEFAEPGSASSPNNLIASSALVQDGNKTFKYAYAYTYTEQGYPLTQTVVTPTGKSETYNYLYSNQ